MIPTSEKVRQIADKLLWCGSAPRTPLLMQLLDKEPPEVFWPVFNWYYPACDNTWELRDALLELLRRKAGGIDRSKFMDEEARKLFSTLPVLVPVYRGCSRGHKLGISWTLDREMAVYFAHRYRNMTVPDPVVYEMRIPKSAVFTLITDRDEAEVLLDPAKLISSL